MDKLQQALEITKGAADTYCQSNGLFMLMVGIMAGVPTGAIILGLIQRSRSAK